MEVFDVCGFDPLTVLSLTFQEPSKHKKKLPIPASLLVVTVALASSSAWAQLEHLPGAYVRPAAPGGSRGIRKGRGGTKLGLSAADYEKLLGVSGITVYHWEQSKSKPRRSHLPKIVAVRGIGKREAMAPLSQKGM